jgi:hypothetical protein
VTAFFIPGLGTEPRVLEGAYDDMRRQLQLDLGRLPSARRIMRLWTRRGSMDCTTEVGTPDPVRGGTVMAIFDMGPHQPYVVWWQPDDGGPDSACEVLGDNAYAVVEFDE